MGSGETSHHCWFVRSCVDTVDEDGNIGPVCFGSCTTGSGCGSCSTPYLHTLMPFSSNPPSCCAQASLHTFSSGLSRQRRRRKHLRDRAFPEEGSDYRNVRSPGRDVSLRNLCFFAVKSSRLFRESRVNTSTPSTCAAKTRDE